MDGQGTGATAHRDPAITRARIDAAIMAHIDWLVRFQNVMQGIDRETFDPARARDDTICDFGRWLLAHPEDFPQPGLLAATKELHREFHEAAGTAAAALRRFAGPEVTRTAMDALEALSDRLVALLGEVKAAVPAG
jgi:hypothetical protein